MQYFETLQERRFNSHMQFIHTFSSISCSSWCSYLKGSGAFCEVMQKPLFQGWTNIPPLTAKYITVIDFLIWHEIPVSQNWGSLLDERLKKLKQVQLLSYSTFFFLLVNAQTINWVNVEINHMHIQMSTCAYIYMCVCVCMCRCTLKNVLIK